jgi:OFA family oxalate/formate antiporter-like MFS transporter
MLAARNAGLTMLSAFAAASWTSRSVMIHISVQLPALTFALSLDRMLNGVTRPLFGWISDIFGRENTMFGAFLLEGVGIWALSQYGSNPLAFVLLTGLVFFAWGEIYSLFPALCTDIFGPKNAAGNYGLIFTAKGTASLLVPLGNILSEWSGGWHTVFLVSCAMDVIAAFAILLIFKPMRIKMMSADRADVSTADQRSLRSASAE